MHRSACGQVGFHDFLLGEPVEFETVLQDDGRKKAIRVSTLIDPQRAPRSWFANGSENHHGGQYNTQPAPAGMQQHGQRHGRGAAVGFAGSPVVLPNGVPGFPGVMTGRY